MRQQPAKYGNYGSLHGLQKHICDRWLMEVVGAISYCSLLEYNTEQAGNRCIAMNSAYICAMKYINCFKCSVSFQSLSCLLHFNATRNCTLPQSIGEYCIVCPKFICFQINKKKLVLVSLYWIFWENFGSELKASMGQSITNWSCKLWKEKTLSIYQTATHLWNPYFKILFGEFYGVGTELSKLQGQ